MNLVESTARTTASPPRPLEMPAGPHGVLLFHGLSSSPLELQFLARGLQRAGYSVRVPLIDGYTHGHGAPRRPDSRAWEAAALAAFDEMRATHHSVTVGGLCIGAVLALSVAQKRSADLAAVLALSTTLHYDGWAAPWNRRLLALAAYVPASWGIGVPETAPFGVKDERMRRWIETQMRDSGQSTAGAAVLRVGHLVQARLLMSRVRARLPDVVAPVLLVHAREDDAASPRSAFEVAQRTQSRRTRVVLLNDSYHMVSIDREKHRVLAEMREFLAREAQIPQRPSGEPSLRLIPFDRLSPRRSSPS